MYELIRFVLFSAASLFYRFRKVGADIPQDGPLMVIANHPNALIDPIFITGVSKRRLRMMAKAPIFSMPILGSIARAMGCLPVHRAKDGADTKANLSLFEKVDTSLRAGEAALIFPEGISHHQPQLQALKTGAARMVLSAWAHGVTSLRILPVGLWFESKSVFRSDAAILIGQPFVPRIDLAPGADPLDPALVDNVTAQMEAALLHVTINTERHQDVPLLDMVATLWSMQAPTRAERLLRLSQGLRQRSIASPAIVDALRTHSEALLSRLHQHGLDVDDITDATLTSRQQTSSVLWFLVRETLVFVMALPMALLGSVAWAVPFWAVHLVDKAKATESDMHGTIKVLAGVVLFPLWWVVLVVLAGVFLSPWWALLLGLVLPGCGMTARHYRLARVRAWQQIRSAVTLWRQPQLRDALVADRDALLQAVEEVASSNEAPISS
jgi:glycerol-3-phosphate O-acyltransferase / dihydroxyacetone phosphate acyltransferase